MPNNDVRTQELLAQEGLESIAQKLYNNINIELSGKPNSGRRWVWELLQNAKDVVKSNGKIEIEFSDGDVTFSHNGSPFKHDQLLAILSQRSTKAPSYTDDEKQQFLDKILSEDGIDKLEVAKFLDISGRFGTGFMTTYLLSKNISLEGLYSTDKGLVMFEISLDRDADTPDQMKAKVVDSFASFTKLENNLPDYAHDYSDGSTIDTKFVYKSISDGINNAHLGLKDAKNCVQFTFAFVDKIASLKIVEGGKWTTFTRLDSEHLGDIEVVKIQKEYDDDDDELIEIAKVSEKYDWVSIAIPIKHIGENRYEILPLNNLTAKKFTSFPLIGSEEFPLPFIINSPLFNPDDSRSGVFLNLNDNAPFNKKVNLNRQVFERSLILYKKLLTYAATNKWNNVHFLAKSDLPKDIDEIWYRDSVQKIIRKEIIDSEIVVTDDGIKRIKPRDAKFPIYKKTKLNEFWELCKYVIKDKIPQKKDVEIWKEIIEANPKSWLDTSLDFDLDSLLAVVQDSGTFANFSQTYFSTEMAAFDALNKIIRFVEDEDRDLVDRKEDAYRIFPDQTQDGKFVSKSSLSRDENIPKEIKDVLALTGDNWYDKLVKNEITVFERDATLDVSDASNALRKKVEKYFDSSIDKDYLAQLENGLFKLSTLAPPGKLTDSEELYLISKQVFKERKFDSLQEIEIDSDFEWQHCRLWNIKMILKKVASFGDLYSLASELFDLTYPATKINYTEEENDIRFKVDTFLNNLIEFSSKFENSQHFLLAEYAIIPNQVNKFRLVEDLNNDDNIPEDLKFILKAFGIDCREDLLHSGISLTLKSTYDLKWICDKLDDIAINEKENELYKQPIRDLDKWITKKKNEVIGLPDLFKSFYTRRSGIVLNTYEMAERDQFDEILKSGMSADFAMIVKTTAPETVRQLAELSKEISLESALQIIKNHPDITSQRIEQLLELEELSKGWNTESDYSPSDEQKRRNFENGWKGEAFVYKKLISMNFKVQWMNLIAYDNGNFIYDFENEKHFIQDKGDKFDVTATDEKGKVIYVQVKATTTDVANADQIALLISTREWKFVFETSDDESYYLARVFNVNSANPEVYFMRIETAELL
ncbi:MAG TPA: DUF3883 domain-containing protein [Mucilaginibacter sp.]|nr:DUF3883 domain-containing protein [Mucilaginibacter sp.]